MKRRTSPALRWLPVLVRVDFVLAVLLTVLAPLVLLVQAVRARRPDRLAALTHYWRSSSLLMVTVYLLNGERRSAFVCGVAARLLIPWTVLRSGVAGGGWFGRWQALVSGYCLFGAALNLPLLRCAVQNQPSALCRAYAQPAQEFGALLHPGVPRERLARAGEVGLAVFLLIAALLRLRRRD